MSFAIRSKSSKNFETFEKLRNLRKTSKTFDLRNLQKTSTFEKLWKPSKNFEKLRPSKNFDLRKTSKTFEKLRPSKFQLCFTFSNNSFGREKNIVYFMRTLENTLDGATVLLLLPSSDKSLQKRAGSPNPFSALFLL